MNYPAASGRGIFKSNERPKGRGIKPGLRNKLELKIQSELYGKSEIAKIMHNFCHDYRKIICAIHCDLVDCNKTEFPSRSQSFKLFLNFMLSNIKKIFDTLTGDNCSVCIKILDEKLTVRTYLRDNISYRERSDADKYLSSYKYSENTAFKDILDDDIKESFYLCNDLKGRLLEERYNNRNEKWNKYYNACLVVPIRLIVESDEKQEKSNVIGFICVDNFKGRFDKKVGLNILASFGDLSFYLFMLFNELQICIMEAE